jgi:hypothetical protein
MTPPTVLCIGQSNHAFCPNRSLPATGLIEDWRRWDPDPLELPSAAASRLRDERPRQHHDELRVFDLLTSLPPPGEWPLPAFGSIQPRRSERPVSALRDGPWHLHAWPKAARQSNAARCNAALRRGRSSERLTAEPRLDPALRSPPVEALPGSRLDLALGRAEPSDPAAPYH